MPYVTAVKRAIIANSATLNLCLKLRAGTTWTQHSWMLFRTRRNDPGPPKYESAESSYSSNLDTGADVTAITEESYKCIGEQKLTSSENPVCGPSGNRLEVKGWFPGKLSHGTKTAEQRGLRTNLLALSAITALNLAVRVDAATDIGSNIREEYASLFQGLGNLGEEYEIKLKPDATPHNLCTPRLMPLLLREKVRHELDRKELLGVISQVDEPTRWCTGMVVVLKNESI